MSISEFRIICLTPRGEDGLRKNLSEWERLPPHVKLLWKNLYSREIVSESPLIWRCRVKNNALSGLIDPSDLVKKVKSAMKDEGLKNDVDYRVEVDKK